MSHFSANQYNVTGWKQFNANRLAQTTTVKLSVVLAALRTIEPIKIAWRTANPTPNNPKWYSELEGYCRDYPDRAWTCCSLFVQAADIAHETRTHYLLLMVYKAVIGADTYHDKQAAEDAFLAGCLTDAEDDRKMYQELRRGG